MEIKDIKTTFEHKGWDEYMAEMEQLSIMIDIIDRRAERAKNK